MYPLVEAVSLPAGMKAALNRSGTASDDTTKTRFWQFHNATDMDTAELRIFGPIDSEQWWGDEITPDSFASQLGKVTAQNLTVRLSSPGGDVWAGIALANLIRAHPARVTMVVDGIAASIASVVMLAGDEVVIGENAQVMIHDAWSFVAGPAAAMREVADLLDRQSDNIAAAYQKKAGGMTKTWRSRMVAETWYLAEEAVAAGLADRVGTVALATSSDAKAEPDIEAIVAEAYAAGRFRFQGRACSPSPSDVDRQIVNSLAEPPLATGGLIAPSTTTTAGALTVSVNAAGDDEEITRRVHAEVDAALQNVADRIRSRDKAEAAMPKPDAAVGHPGPSSTLDEDPASEPDPPAVEDDTVTASETRLAALLDTAVRAALDAWAVEHGRDPLPAAAVAAETTADPPDPPPPDNTLSEPPPTAGAFPSPDPKPDSWGAATAHLTTADDWAAATEHLTQEGE